MKSKNIESEIEELNDKLKALELKHNNLQLQHLQDNNRLQGRVLDLERTNRNQTSELESLRQSKDRSGRSFLKKPENNSSDKIQLTRESFNKGDLVKITNNLKGRYGTIGRVYHITAAQVHFTNIKGGESLTRAFKNVEILNLSEEERRNLFQK